MESIHRSMARSGLIRSDERWLAGVCGGVAAKFNVDVNAIRFILILMLILPGSQVLIYALLWVIMPDSQRARQLLSAGTAPAAQDPIQDTTKPGTF